MQGLKGLRKCKCDANQVWGLHALDYKKHPLSLRFVANPEDPHDSRGPIPEGCKVFAKDAPYMASYGGTGLHKFPDKSKFEDFVYEISLRGVNAGYHPHNFNFEVTENSCVGARCTYVDGRQAYVNYVHGGDDFNNLAFATVAQLDTATNSGAMHHLPPISAAASGFFILFGSGDMQQPQGSGSRPIKPWKWGVGAEYMVCTTYDPGDATWSTYRVKLSDSSEWWFDLDTGFDLTDNAICLPAIRTNLRTSAPQPDEPWVVVRRGTDNRFATGRWLNTDLPTNALKDSEIENILVDDPSLGITGVVCYNRVSGVDLAIFHGELAGYYIYDGDSLTHVADDPEFITADKEGNILYGSFEFVRKLGPNGWYKAAPASRPDSTMERGSFQILCNNDWYQLRHFRGQPELASGNLNVTIDGTEYHYDPGGEVGNRIDAWYILNWSVSPNGEIWVPHLQADPATPAQPSRRRLTSRTYSSQPRNERVLLEDPENPGEFITEQVWYTDDGLGSTSGVHADTDRGHSYHVDYDIVDCPTCCCGCKTATYY